MKLCHYNQTTIFYIAILTATILTTIATTTTICLVLIGRV